MDKDLFQNRYRIASTRLQGYDYSEPADYFVTICAKNYICWFGKVIDEKMGLSIIGKIVADEWQKTEEIRKNVKLDEWIVMPNHMHGIITILPSPVETHCNASLHRTNPTLDEKYRNKFGLQSNNLPAIIRGFKGAATNRIRSAGYYHFAWQGRYYDHIIRSEKSLERICQYIIDNPYNWHLDRNNPINLKNAKTQAPKKLHRHS